MLRFHVPNMACGGCATSVARALSSIDPKARIETDPSTRGVRVESSVDEQAFLAVLDAAGYPAERRPEAAAII